MTPDGAMLWCRLCRQAFPSPPHFFCPVHPSEELGQVPAGETGHSVSPDPPMMDEDPARVRTTCWNCGTQAKDLTNTTCATCHASLAPPALVIDFPDGLAIVAARGTSVELGRAGRFGHVFRRYKNVSRLHATISVDEEGDAWITPNPAAPNGTFIEGCEIYDRTAIRPGVTIRFATDQEPHVGPKSTRIRLPQREVS